MVEALIAMIPAANPSTPSITEKTSNESFHKERLRYFGLGLALFFLIAVVAWFALQSQSEKQKTVTAPILRPTVAAFHTNPPVPQSLWASAPIPFPGKSTSVSQQRLRLAVIGDSLSAGVPRKTIPTFGAANLTWVDLLALSGRVDLGEWQTDRPGRPGPGWANLYATFGVTNTDVLKKTWIDELIAKKQEIDAVVVFLGHNEMTPLIGETASQQVLPDERILSVASRYSEELSRILDPLVRTFGQRVLVMLPADWTCTPMVQGLPLPLSLTQRLRQATYAFRTHTLDAAKIRSLPTFDSETLLRRLTEPTNLDIGGVSIAIRSISGSATSGFLPDGIHFTTVLHGRLANAILKDVPGITREQSVLSDTEILMFAGISTPEKAL